MTDVLTRVQRRVDRLISRAVAELKSRGIDATGRSPQQIFRIARAARVRAVVSAKGRLS